MNIKQLKKYYLLDLILITGIILIVSGGFLLVAEEPETDREIQNVQNEQDNYPEGQPGFLQKENESEVKVIIPEGVNTRKVALILEENNIFSAPRFLYFVELFDLDKRIKAGTYYFKQDNSLEVILEKILIP